MRGDEADLAEADGLMSSHQYKDLAVVKGIGVHPVKSMRGFFVDSAKVGFAGLPHDREYAFLDLDDQSGLPFLSARQHPALLRYSAHVEEFGERHARVVVLAPGGKEYPIRDAGLLAEIADLVGARLQLVRLWRRAYDSAGADVSLITTQSISAIGDQAGRVLEPERFRPNILVEALSDAPFREEKWVGASVAVGDGGDVARLRLTRKDPRCRIVSLDPMTGDEDRNVHKVVVSARRNNLGAYATVERTGLIRVGDAVRQRQI
jgi:uncharacterized protein YcbX